MFLFGIFPFYSFWATVKKHIDCDIKQESFSSCSSKILEVRVPAAWASAEELALGCKHSRKNK